ncbi:MAG: hypothetical protein FWD31_02655 [Planctomycetaceae bacterium]|nr:hypothetical protein [Planctomycetaceae bacterium]
MFISKSIKEDCTEHQGNNDDYHVINDHHDGIKNHHEGKNDHHGMPPIVVGTQMTQATEPPALVATGFSQIAELLHECHSTANGDKLYFSHGGTKAQRVLTKSIISSCLCVRKKTIMESIENTVMTATG